MKIKKQSGVTLVTLVVTIIVLIILAGISINLALGNNGIITLAEKSKENTELAKVEEEQQLNELYKELETEGGNSSTGTNDSVIEKLTDFKKAIANAIGDAGGVKPEFSAETTVFENNIKGIVKEVTKDATATEDSILNGKTAWVNGKLVTGTSVILTSLPDITFSCNAGQYGTETGSRLVTTIPAGYTKITASGGVADLYKNNTALSTTTGTYDTKEGDVWKCVSHWHGATISLTLSAN